MSSPSPVTPTIRVRRPLAACLSVRSHQRRDAVFAAASASPSTPLGGCRTSVRPASYWQNRPIQPGETGTISAIVTRIGVRLDSGAHSLLNERGGFAFSSLKGWKPDRLLARMFPSAAEPQPKVAPVCDRRSPVADRRYMAVRFL